MKKGYKIGLFFVIIVIVVLIVLILIKRANYSQIEEEIEDNSYISSQVDNNEEKTTCDTLVLYQNIDKKDGTITYKEEKIPAKYINMNRQELENAIQEDNKSVGLLDKELGFVSQHLELFSSQRIKITRIYDTSKEETGYYLMAYNHAIWIYKSDKKTVYFKTDLTLDDVPDKVRDEILKGKYMRSEIEIYNFLESYSS